MAGAVCVGLSLESFRRMLLDAKLERGANFVLLDHRGVILSRGVDEGKFVGKPYHADSFAAMVTGPDSLTFEGPGLVRDRRIISYRKLWLPGEDEPLMYLRVGIPVANALSAANRALAKNLAFFFSFLLLAIAFAAFVGKRSIADRVAALEDASRRVAAGNLAVRVSEVVRGGELGRLGETFDAMAAKLASRERALLESERNCHEIFDATSDGILVADAASGRILVANRAAQALFGCTREELLALRIEELCGPASERIARSVHARRGRGVRVAGPPQGRRHLLGGGDAPADAPRRGRAHPRGGARRQRRKRAEVENERLQAQLLHAQKMESVGRLAGGDRP